MKTNEYTYYRNSYLFAAFGGGHDVAHGWIEGDHTDEAQARFWASLTAHQQAETEAVELIEVHYHN